MSDHQPIATADHPPTAEDARRMLRDADRAAHRAPSQMPAALVSLGVLCATGSFGTTAMHLVSRIPATASFSPVTSVIITSFAWILAGLVPILLVRDRWRRGLAARWLIAMGVWALLWVLGMVLASSILALVISPMFLVLFVVVFAHEASLARRDAQARSAR